MRDMNLLWKYRAGAEAAVSSSLMDTQDLPEPGPCLVCEKTLILDECFIFHLASDN